MWQTEVILKCMVFRLGGFHMDMMEMSFPCSIGHSMAGELHGFFEIVYASNVYHMLPGQAVSYAVCGHNVKNCLLLRTI